MSRRKKNYKREILPDPVFKDVIITKFVNRMMLQGKKGIAQKLLYGALDEIKGKTADEPLVAFKKAIENVKPSIEVRSRRVGGATYQVPVDVRPSRRLALSMKWIISNARERGEKDFAKRFTNDQLSGKDRLQCQRNDYRTARDPQLSSKSGLGR